MTVVDSLKNIGAAGTAAVITVTFIHPIDVVKTRLQVSGENTRNYKALGIGGTVRVILKEEGLKSFWKGINAAWLREASYTSLRLGLYDPIKNIFNIRNDSPFIMKFLSGSLAGAIGSIAGNPFDVLKTRFMATESLNMPTLRATSKEIYEGLGMKGFYRGLEANIMRAMVLNGTMMGCYDQINSMIDHSQLIAPGVTRQFVSAFATGFVMACTVTPFDMLRTTLMNQPTHSKLYSGFVDCAVKLVKSKGPSVLYSGFVPIWARFAPTTTLQLVIFEQIKPIFGVGRK